MEVDPRLFLISNFAATCVPILERVSPLEKVTSEIIDAFSNANYAFWDVSVGFRRSIYGINPRLRVMDSTLYAMDSGILLRGTTRNALNGWPDNNSLVRAAGSFLEIFRWLVVPFKRKRPGRSLNRLNLRNILGHRRPKLSKLAGRNQHPAF